MSGIRRGSACAAQAEDDGWYIGGNLPLMFIDDTDSTAAGSFAQTQPGPQGQTVSYSATVRTEHDTGYKLGGVLGRSFGSGLRIEGEVFIANAEVSKLTHSGIAVPSAARCVPSMLGSWASESLLSNLMEVKARRKRSKAQGHPREVVSEGSVEQNRDLTNRNRI